MIALAFFWHQHQPYYPDDVSGENPMPWVRLHGVKDYYGMALHLDEFPEMRCTINLVPSLVLQLLQYTDQGRSDRFLDVSRIPANDLSEADALFLLDHFFMANADTMILPFARFGELYARRGLGRDPAKRALKRFSERDLRDLQVWFNLAWVHPLAIEQDDTLRGLREQGRHFSESDKNALLDKHLEILRRVLPLHRKLAERGQVELTTTPYYHPILPLLLDKRLAREAMPDVRLPQHTTAYPDDAEFHVATAMQQHAQLFGSSPRGMWPAEGSVCQSMIPLLAKHGVKWIATDEEVLTASTHGLVGRDGRGHVRNPDLMYRPYKVREGDSELSIVFRDHALSDQIGFRYQHSDPVAAVDDFFGCLGGIRQSIPSGETPLVSVILDGENCWEHYPGGGVAFLRELYARCTQSKHVRALTIGDYLERHPPTDTLPHLFAGSWISHNFAIWIGHEEDNTAWDALHRTREHLSRIADCRLQIADGKTDTARRDDTARRASEGSSHLQSAICNLQSPLERAWRELYIAEGSDWFWWFGDDHSSAQDATFDYLFRQHLKNVYLLLGEEPPADLDRPISRRGQRVQYTQPRSLLEVTIDGRYTFFEWLRAGHYNCHNERGTMAMAMKGPLVDVYFGFDLNRLLIRIDCDDPARSALSECDELRIGFVEPAGYELVVAHPGRVGSSASLRHREEVIGANLEWGIDRIAEAAIPFDALEVPVGGRVQFFVEVSSGGQSRDRAPRQGTIQLARPSVDFERIMWDV